MKRFAKLVAFGVVAATTLSVASAAHAQETPIEQSDPTAILEFPVEPQVTSSVTVGAEGATGATANTEACLLYTSPSPRDGLLSRMPSSA